MLNPLNGSRSRSCVPCGRPRAAAAPWAIAFAALLAGGAALVASRAGSAFVSPSAQRDATPTPGTRPDAPDPAAPGVNVVIYVVDTLRADRLGVYGYGRNTSPRLTALAGEAVVFDNCNAGAPWTLPSVTSLITSTYPCEHGVVLIGDQLAPSIQTLTQKLASIGYSTCALSCNVHVHTSGLDRGFDFFAKINAVAGPITEFWINGVQRKPMYVYIHTMEPHDPYKIRPQYFKEFGEVQPDAIKAFGALQARLMELQRADYKWNSDPANKDRRRPLGSTDNTSEQAECIAALDRLKPQIDAMYDGAIRQADDNLGGTIDALVKAGQWDNTLFIFTSDHGEEMGDHGGWLHDQSVYEELARVPLLVKFPRGEFRGKRIADVVSLLDVLPTVFDVLGRPELARGARGRSLLPLVREERHAADELRVTTVRINELTCYKPFKVARGDRNVVVRQGAWKGIYNVEQDALELYDLAADPRERINLAGQNAERSAAMLGFAKGWVEACGKGVEAAERRGLEGLSEADRLRALPYIGGGAANDARPPRKMEQRPASRPASP